MWTVGFAQSKNATPEPNNEPEAVSPDDVDHYDPDDTKQFDDVVTEDRTVTVRGRDLVLHLYRPKKDGEAIPAIYACGDGGWRGLAPRTGEELAHMGAAVVGLDSKIYLRELSSPKAPLTIKQLADDYAQLATVARSLAKTESQTPVYVYGWSLGAGFAVAVGSEKTNRDNWAGIVSIGLPSQNQLASGVGGNHVDLKNPATMHLGFRTQSLIAAITPLPLMMIQSTTDTASPQKVGKMLFTTAQDPKRFVLIKANNHRFTGAREEFYSALGAAFSWIKEARATNLNKQQPVAVIDGEPGTH
jgi:dienelactone hydrolase